MRILVISAEHNSQLYAGFPTMFAELSKAFSRNAEVYVLCNEGRGYINPFLSFWRNLFPRYIREGRIIWLYPPILKVPLLQYATSIFSSVALATLLWTFRLLRVDIICCSGCHIQGFIGSILKRITGRPLIVDFGDAPLSRAKGLRALLAATLERVVLSPFHANVVICDDPVLQDYVRCQIGRPDVMFFPPGYDATLFEDRPEWYSVPDELHKKEAPHYTVLYTGKIDYSIYPIPILLDAASQVVKQIPQTRFVIAGMGPDIDDVRARIMKNDLAGRVVLTGKLPHSKISEVVESADVCVQITVDKAVGLKLVEYMRRGKAIVVACSWYDKYRSFLIDGVNCILVQLDAEKLSSAIVTLLKDSRMRREMGEKAKKAVLNWTWEKNASLRLAKMNMLLQEEPRRSFASPMK